MLLGFNKRRDSEEAVEKEMSKTFEEVRRMRKNVHT